MGWGPGNAQVITLTGNPVAPIAFFALSSEVLDKQAFMDDSELSDGGTGTGMWYFHLFF